jgi:hypothetical protein
VSEPITFRATLPPIQSAIKIGDKAMRVQFDIAELDLVSALPLIGLQGKVFEVKLRVLTNFDEDNESERTRRKAGAETERRATLGPLDVDSG